VQLQTGETLLLTSVSGQLNIAKDAASLLITIEVNSQIDDRKLVFAVR